MKQREISINKTRTCSERQSKVYYAEIEIFVNKEMELKGKESSRGKP